MLETIKEFLSSVSWDLLLAFFISQLVNVILSTVKSVLTVKGTRLTATIINTVSYTLNAAVISQIGNVDNIYIVCIFTAITNIIGVWFSLWLLDKLRKESLWRISATVRTQYAESLKKDLTTAGIGFITYNTNWAKRVPIDVFSSGREESRKIKEIFNAYDVKYTISVNRGEL